ncbi:MAG: energy-coupling factor transporter ATP-binding protein EcfA2 [Bacteriovoracaceae bacterium]
MNEEKVKKRPKVRTISDTPASSDAFGPHKRIADALYSVIQDEPGSKAIALAGSWGSGKSTVVKLFEGLVDKNKEAVFVFDAWSHEGDPLRRSFLESFLEYLEDIEWTKGERWKTEKEKISRRREESQTIVSSGLSEYGKGLAFSTIAVPLGVALVSKHGMFFDNPPNVLVQFLPIGLTIFPILFGTLIWLAMRPWRKIFQKGFITTNKAPYEDESFYSILRTGKQEITKNITSKTPDPTSLEFNQLFSDILEETLKGNEKKLVIVMDNLDRIAPETAINIWATMRVFFDTHETKSQEIRNRFWLLVPFDPNAIESLWRREGNDGTPVNFAKSFIDKSFQLTFHVAPPVLSDWKNFLFSQLKEALPEHTEEDFHGVYRIYLLSNREPSPRDMKIFVNEIGELYRQWGENIPLVLQAAYVLNRNKDRSEIEQKISSGKFLDESFKSVINITDWQKYIAALHFNVELDKALQVLVRPDIERAFAKGEPGGLESVREVPAFEENCEQLINESYKEWSKEEPRTIAYTAYVLSELGVTKSQPAQRSWADLIRACNLVKSWTGLDSVSSKGLDLLMKNSPQDKSSILIHNIVKGITSLVPNQNGDKEEPTLEWVEHSCDAIAPVIETIIDLGQSSILEKNFYIPGEASSYIQVLHDIGSSRPSLRALKHFVTKCTSKQLADSLVALVNSGGFTVTHSEVIKSLHLIGFTEWQSVVTAIQTRLDPGTALQGAQSSGLLKSLLFLHFDANIKAATTSIQHCVSQGFLPHHLHQYNAEKNQRYQSDAVLLMMFFNPAGQNQRNIGNSNTGCNYFNQVKSTPDNYKEIISALGDYVQEFKLVDSFVKLLADANVSTLATAALIEALSNREASKSMSGQQLIDNISALKDKFKIDELEKVALDLAEKSDLIEVILSQGFDESLDRVYKYLAEADTEEIVNNNDLVDFLVEGIQETGEDVWIEQLESEGDLLDVGIALVSLGEALSLEACFADPLLKETKKQRTEPELPEWLGKKNRWGSMTSFLDISFRDTFFRDLVDDLIARPTLSFSTLIGLLGEEIISSVALEEKADDLFRSLAKESLEENRLSKTELDWFTRCLTNNNRVTINIKPASKKTLKKRVGSLLKDSELKEEIESSLKSLNKVLN